MKRNNFVINAEIGQKGLTLIEVMVAMVILGVGIMAIVALQTHNMNYNSKAKRQTQAYTWAANRVEKLLALSYTKSELLSVGVHTPSTDAKTTMAPYVMEWDVIDNTASIPNSREVIVRVWKSKESKESKLGAIAQIKFIRVQSSI